MVLRVLAVLLCATLFGAISASPALGLEDADYASIDARLTDSKGVVTDLADFGFATGVNVLMAQRGDGDLDLPLRLVARLDISAVSDATRRAPCTAWLRSGKSISIEIGDGELSRLMVGRTEFGEYRVRLAKVRRLEFAPTSRVGS